MMNSNVTYLAILQASVHVKAPPPAALALLQAKPLGPLINKPSQGSSRFKPLVVHQLEKLPLLKGA